MMTHKLIERIEGEAILDFKTDKQKAVREAWIRFPHFRGMEMVLEGRPALDSLVITPRVCGICGHSHLLAAARMIESAYHNAGETPALSPKAESIREITRICELIQNHIKWFYLTMLNESASLVKEGQSPHLKAIFAAAQINRLSALFSGQWPHSAYILPGGVSCDPTYVEVMQAQGILKGLVTFLETELFGEPIEMFESGDYESWKAKKGDFSLLLHRLERLQLLDEGKSHNRFLVMGSHFGSRTGILEGENKSPYTFSKVSEKASVTCSDQLTTYANNALYNGAFYETGPLPRALLDDYMPIVRLYRSRGDCALTRISARVAEIARQVLHLKTLLEKLELDEPSFIVPGKIDHISGEGIGIVEAPRGTLIHQAVIDKGKIVSYSIITPTQWNLGNGNAENPGVAQKAMIGAESIAKAVLLFRTFDVCSVCTTH